MRRRRRNKLWLIIPVLSVTLAATIYFSVQATDVVVRRVFIGRLMSDDATRREQGLNYIHRHASDPAVRRAVAELTVDCDAELLRYIAGAMHSADAWGPAMGRGWVRNLVVPLEHADADYRAAVARDFARAATAGEPVQRDRLLVETVEKLSEDPAAMARWYALRAAAATRPTGPVIDALRGDAEPAIGRMANQIDALAGDGQFRDIIAEAAKDLSDVPPEQRDLVTEWREVLLGPWPDQGERVIGDQLLGLAMRAGEGQPMADALMGAAVTRAWQYLPKPIRWTGEPRHTLSELAAFESAPPRSLEIESFDGLPDLVRVAALRAAKAVEPEDFIPVLGSEHASVRHLAVFLAMDRFDEATLDRLTHQLSTIFFDERRMSGAMLIGLRGRPLDLLDDRLKREHVWIVRQHLVAAQYMVGRNDGWADTAPEALLARRDFPMETVIIALMHRGNKQGLDRLLKPIGTPGYTFAQTYAKWRYDTEQLRELLDEKRFDPVLRRYLPEAPPVWLWADPDLQRFQVELLRNWYLIHRAELSFDHGRFVVR